MKTQQRALLNGTWVSTDGAGAEVGWQLPGAQLVMVFGAGELMAKPELLAEVQAAHPQAQVVGCSSAGEVMGKHVYDGAVVMSAIQFEHTRVRVASADVVEVSESFAVGSALGAELLEEDVAHVLVICYGLFANATELIRGLSGKLPVGVAVTGGLAGDGLRFQETAVYLNGVGHSRKVVVVGLYGKRLQVGFGSQGGSEPFGQQKVVTRAEGNTLYELDGKPALPFYKKFMGTAAVQLPASSVYFPVNLRTVASDRPLARTVCAINEEEQSITFAGDMPEGVRLQMLRMTEESLIAGAAAAASTCRKTLGVNLLPEFALMFTCIGRKMVLQGRTEEEVSAVEKILQAKGLMGFFSYGEIAPFDRVTRCELHNQTITLTVFSEV